eukprot:TRINITY_DN7008_c0_g1_i2.p1 TRINITY_DN7008_c0_g1~~TRINITY_DN7008_c0_g1_i2.p1  ORF type:complete len:530 (-),score=78.75 TRINITY_DN7008_c0_g1_i2:377-1966(-)
MHRLEDVGLPSGKLVVADNDGTQPHDTRRRAPPPTRANDKTTRGHDTPSGTNMNSNTTNGYGRVHPQRSAGSTDEPDYPPSSPHTPYGWAHGDARPAAANALSISAWQRQATPGTTVVDQPGSPMDATGMAQLASLDATLTATLKELASRSQEVNPPPAPVGRWVADSITPPLRAPRPHPLPSVRPPQMTVRPASPTMHVIPAPTGEALGPERPHVKPLHRQQQLPPHPPHTSLTLDDEWQLLLGALEPLDQPTSVPPPSPACPMKRVRSARRRPLPVAPAPSASAGVARHHRKVVLQAKKRARRDQQQPAVRKARYPCRQTQSLRRPRVGGRFIPGATGSRKEAARSAGSRTRGDAAGTSSVGGNGGDGGGTLGGPLDGTVAGSGGPGIGTDGLDNGVGGGGGRRPYEAVGDNIGLLFEGDVSSRSSASHRPSGRPDKAKNTDVVTNGGTPGGYQNPTSLPNVVNPYRFLPAGEGNLYAAPSQRQTVAVEETMEEKIDGMLSRCTWVDGEVPPMAVACFEWMGMAHHE